MQQKQSNSSIPIGIQTAIKNIKPISPYVLEIVTNTSLEDLSLLDLARKLSFEPVLSAKLLDATRAAAYGLNKEIESVFQAVSILGSRRVLDIIVASSLQESFGKTFSTVEYDIWEHSLQVAYAMQTMLRELNIFITPMARAFTTGLIHDIGKLVLLQYLKNEKKEAELAEFSKNAVNGGDRALAYEGIRFKVTHVDIGAYLAKSWSMPNEMVTAIANHHMKDKRRFPNGLTRLLIWAHTLVDKNLTPDQKRSMLPFSIIDKQEEIMGSIQREVDNIIFFFEK
ncbi:MAG: HDOD domain-containing protein [Dissulfuribacterales bacterium]